MATGQRGEIDTAVSQLLDLVNSEPDNVPACVALAHGFMLLKQDGKVTAFHGWYPYVLCHCTTPVTHIDWATGEE